MEVSNFDEDIINFNLSGQDGIDSSGPKINIEMVVDTYTEPANIQVLIQSPGDTQYWTTAEAVSTSNFKINYDYTFDAPNDAPSGIWFLRKVRLINASGAEIEYDDTILKNKGFNTSVDLYNPNSDNNAPDLVSLGSFEVNGNDSDPQTNIEVNFVIEVNDQEDAFNRAYGVLESPKHDGGDGNVSDVAIIDKSTTPNTASFTWVLDPKTVSGEYRIDDIRLYDSAGNRHIYYGCDNSDVEDCLGEFGNYKVTIENPIEDNQTPQLSDFKLSGSYDDDGRKTLTVRTLIDNGATQETDIKRQYIRIIGPNTGNIDDDKFVLQSDGYYQLDVLLPLEADDGDYEVSYWFIVDDALNDNYLTGSEIAELGFSNKISFNGAEANNKPIITSSSFTIDENQTNIGTIQVFDGDDDVLTYALSGGDSESISIDSASGVLSFNNAPDYETKSAYAVIVEVSDDVHVVQKAIAIEINNLNDNTPVISSSASFSINEGETNVGQVSATDADGDSISYSISGSDASALTIDSSSGVLTFNSAPDFNTKSSYSITATASDGENAADQNVTIDINNVNENAPTFTSTSTFNVDENQTLVGTVVATDPDGDTITYSVSGNDAFSIDASSGVLTFNTAPDYENNSGFNVTATASDGDYSVNQTITVNINDLNDNSPVFTSNDSFTVAENQISVGTFTSTDADQNTSIIYSLSGTDALAFNLNSASGVFSFINEPDYEVQSSYSMVANASDGANNTTQNVTITISDVNEAPTITSGVIFRPNENQTAIGSIEATDPEGDNLIYLIFGTDASEITVNNATGALTFNASPDYETKSSYSIVGQVNDGTLIAQKAFQIELVNLNDNIPVFTSAETFSPDENQTSVGTVVATDADGDALAYSISGTDASSFILDTTSGVLAFDTPPDYEAKSSYDIVISATDGLTSVDQNIAVQVNNLNDNVPVFTSSLNISVEENETSAGTIQASDADGDDLSFTITGGADASSFTLNETTGALTFNTAPDHETKSSYSLIITVSDGEQSTESAFAIAITDLNDSGPVFTSSDTLNRDEQDFLVGNQDQWSNYTVVTLGATDDLGEADNEITFTLAEGFDNNDFRISDGNNLHIWEGLDYENPVDQDDNNVYEIAVTATNSIGSTVQNITVTINNVNDEAVVCQSDSVVEEIVEGFGSVTINVSNQLSSCVDVDGFPITFDLDFGSNQGDKDILNAVLDTVNQTLTVDTTNIDYENAQDANDDNTYFFRIEANDGGSSDTISVNIPIQNVNDNAPRYNNSVSYTWTLNESTGPEPAGWATGDSNNWMGSCVYDLDGLGSYTDISISLSGADADKFELMDPLPDTFSNGEEDCSNSNQGYTGRRFALQPLAYQDFETNNQNTYSFNLDLSDGELTSQTEFTVNVVNRFGVHDSSTPFTKSVSFRSYWAENSSKVFLKNDSLNQKQPWGTGITFYTESLTTAATLLQISQLGSDSNNSATEDMIHVFTGYDSGGQYIEFKYHQVLSTSNSDTWGYTIKTYVNQTNQQNWWGLYIDFDGTSFADSRYDASAFRLYLVDLNGGTGVVDLVNHPNSTITYTDQTNENETDAYPTAGYFIDWKKTYNNQSGNNFGDRYASLVTTTFLPDDLPDTTEIEMIITDPNKWLTDYKIGQDYRRYSGDDVNEAGHLLQDFQINNVESANSTQVYLFCEYNWDEDSSSIPNEVWTAENNNDNDSQVLKFDVGGGNNSDPECNLEGNIDSFSNNSPMFD